MPIVPTVSVPLDVGTDLVAVDQGAGKVVNVGRILSLLNRFISHIDSADAVARDDVVPDRCGNAVQGNAILAVAE